MKKTFIGTCVNNPFQSFNALETVINNAIEITKRTFLRNCETEFQSDYNINPLDMEAFPNDFSYHRSRSNGEYIYFFTHSAIEYFYK